jgi:hypothetical protein
VQSLAEEASTPREPVRLTPAKPLPRMSAEPVVRTPAPPMPRLADGPIIPREPARLAPRYPKDAPPPPAPLRVTNPPPADHVRSARVSSPEPNYVVGQNLVGVGGIVTIVPGAVYATRYLIAPSAKIISIDTDD